jgi:tetratricopeptide (TPR) repeat protein
MKWLWDSLGRISEKKKDFSAAIRYYEKARNLQALARVREGAGHHSEALRIYAELEQFEDAARVALLMGDAPTAASFYRRAGQDDRALQTLLEHGAIADAVTLLLELGRPQEAAQIAEQHGDLRRAASIYLELQEEDKAIALLKKLNDVRGLLAIYLKRRDFQAAAEECRRAGQISLAASLFEQAGLYAESARLYEETGNSLQAAQLFEKAEEFEQAAKAYEKAGRLDRAVEAYCRAPGCERRAAEIYESLVRLESARVVEFEAPVVAMALSAQADVGCVALGSGRLLFTSRAFETVWHWRAEGERVIREVGVAPPGTLIVGAVDGIDSLRGDFLLVGLDSSKNLVFSQTMPAAVRGIAFSPVGDSSYVYCVGETVAFCEGKQEPRWEFTVDFCAWETAFAPSREMLAVGSLGGTLYLLASDGTLIGSRKFEDRVHQLAFSSDGRLLAAAVGDTLVVLCLVPSLEVIAMVSTAETPRRLVALQQSADQFVSCGTYKLELLRPDGSKCLLLTTETSITNVAADPLDFLLYVATSDNKITCYQIRDCKQLAAEWYAKAKDFAKAAQLYEEVANYEKAYELYQLLGDYERAASNIQRVGDSRTAARNYEIVGKYDRAALLYEEMGDLPRAAKCYANAGNFLKAAKLYEDLGEQLLAAEFYEQAGERRQAGYLFRALEQNERAVENWEAYLREHPDDVPVAFELAKIYAETARYNEAIKQLQAIQDHAELRRDVLRLMAECFIEKGLYEVAADRLLDALGPAWKAQRDNLDLVYDLALAYERAGRLEEAKDLYSKVLAVDYYYRDVLQKLEKTRERITMARQETQMAAVAGQAAPAADPFGATVSAKVTKESLRYKIVRKLGQGGMGIVYLALDTRLGRYVAWKVLPAHLAGNPEFQKRLLQEACAIAQVAHPHIVAVYDVVTAPDECFLTMEYVDGPSLRAVLSREKTLPIGRGLRYAMQMASALAAAHQAQIIHRDVKPENVMIAAASDTVKMVDFGLARLAEDANVTREGCVVGTVTYMAPEQIRGESLDGRTDIYALGVVLFEMLAGRPPFVGQNILAQHLHVPAPPLNELVPEIPKAVSQLVAQCLEKNPDDRPRDAVTLHDELNRLASEFAS